MSASTGTINSGLGTRQVGTALAGVALAVAVAAGLAFGVSNATRSQATQAAAPAAGFDHGSSIDLPSMQVTSGAGTFDHGSSIDLPSVKLPVNPGGHGPRRFAE
jgi:hypothetical protein